MDMRDSLLLALGMGAFGGLIALTIEIWFQIRRGKFRDRKVSEWCVLVVLQVILGAVSAFLVWALDLIFDMPAGIALASFVAGAGGAYTILRITKQIDPDLFIEAASIDSAIADSIADSNQSFEVVVDIDMAVATFSQSETRLIADIRTAYEERVKAYEEELLKKDEVIRLLQEDLRRVPPILMRVFKSNNPL